MRKRQRSIPKRLARQVALGDILIGLCKKKYYTTKGQAKEGMQGLIRRGAYCPERLSVYKCKDCGGWHFGHTER
jgi:hypothetical protein